MIWDRIRGEKPAANRLSYLGDGVSGGDDD
jgi:hypothetical protein